MTSSPGWNPFAWLKRAAGAAPTRLPASPEEHEVAQVLEELRPALALDGGAVELEHVTDGWVHLRWAGACRSCSFNAETLRAAIEPRLRERLPWVQGVRAN